VCFWQDDFVDNHDTDVIGPNSVRLSVARANFAQWGASERRWIDRVRPPPAEEGPPAPWTESRRPEDL
jgi:hypothetical protein